MGKQNVYFPHTEAYQRLNSARTFPGRERRRPPHFAFTERHVKCVWFDEAVRPARLRTDQGDAITVEHPGHWNLEAGPDFLGATLRVGSGQRHLAGDVEIHIHPSDWHRHGHAQDPAYARVIAHVTYFPGHVPTDSLPPGSVQIALKDPLSANPCFSFETLDVTAYPYARRASATPCARILASWTPVALAALFESAGEERLRRKAERLTLAMEEKDPDQVFYEELMSALGYKRNPAPFRTLATQVPLAALRERSGLDVTTAYALLMGRAGLLPAQTDPRWDPETRTFIRHLWNRWWKHQAPWSPGALKPTDWTLSGLRPQNHPRRRLMAAAILFTQKRLPVQQLVAIRTDTPELWMDRVTDWLHPKRNTYWRTRLALGGRRQPTEISLTGERRAAAILSNVILPFLAARKAPAFPGIELLRRLPAEEDNSIVRQTAYDLLGPDHNPKLYRTGLRQQGVIQIFHDFCLNDRSRCAACPLRERLDAFPREG